jgi:hypothetical protein
MPGRKPAFPLRELAVWQFISVSADEADRAVAASKRIRTKKFRAVPFGDGLRIWRMS